MHHSRTTSVNFLAAALSLSLGLGLAACGSSDDTKDDDTKASKKDDAKDEAKDDAKDTKGAKDDAKDAKDEAKPKDESGGGPSVALKDLVVVDQGGLKAVYDPDASVWRWESDDYFSSIVVRALSEKVDNMDDLKAEAPMMMALGTAIEKVNKEEKGTNGWYAIVESDGTPTFIYIMKLGGLQFTCSASLKTGMGKAHTEAEVKKACESIKTK
jgi:hypothetical protein